MKSSSVAWSTNWLKKTTWSSMPSSARARDQAVAIGLALIAHEIRMGRAENDIDGVRAGFDDFRHGIDHGLDALARRQQAERQDDGLSGEAEFALA